MQVWFLSVIFKIKSVIKVLNFDSQSAVILF
jgi:hypothetical protein